MCADSILWMKETQSLCHHSPLFKSTSVINHTLSSKRPHTCGETENIGFAAGCQDLCHFPTILIIHFPTIIMFSNHRDYEATKCQWYCYSQQLNASGGQNIAAESKTKNCYTGKLTLHSISSLCFSGI